MGKFPIEKPSPEEMRRAVQISGGKAHVGAPTVIRYRIDPDPPLDPAKLAERGHCIQMSRIIEVRIPDSPQGIECATWWQVFGE